MRKLLVLAVLLGVSAAAQKQTHPGKERWPIKTSVPDGTNLSKARKIPLADLLAMPDAPDVKHNDARYQSARIPAQSGGKYKEGELLAATGWLFLVAAESDGDYHIQVSGSATSGDHCVVVEVPNPDPEYTKSADLRPKFDAVRTFIKTKLLAGKEPSSNGSVMQHPVYVTITGALFYDDSHVGDQPRGKKGMKAATLWELHPVTAIAFAPKPK
jgi:hypothetical protein